MEYVNVNQRVIAIVYIGIISIGFSNSFPSVFLVKREEKRLAIVKTSNAVNPLVWNDIVRKIELLCTLSILLYAGV